MAGGGTSGIVWFRRDLRVRDHPALRAALDAHDNVVTAFCFDDRLLHGRHASGPRTQFLLECLADLDRELRERGGGLVIRRGPPERELAGLAAETGATVIHATQDVSPFARRRGERVRAALGDSGIELRSHEGLNAVDVRSIETGAGKPYTVFSPFHRKWLQAPRRQVLEAPARAAAAALAPGQGPDPVAGVARARPGGQRSRPRRRVRGAAGARPLPRRPRARVHRDP